MHQSVMDWLRTGTSAEEIGGRTVLEVGSQNVNGSPREVFGKHAPKSYLGVDFAPGACVDRVVDASKLVETFGEEAFDVVISTEMLEHAQDWRSAVSGMKSVLKQGGLLLITTRSPGFPYHGYPHDYWRYTLQHFKDIFVDMWVQILEQDPECPGVFLKARKTGGTGHVDLATINVDPVVR